MGRLRDVGLYIYFFPLLLKTAASFMITATMLEIAAMGVSWRSLVLVPISLSGTTRAANQNLMFTMVITTLNLFMGGKLIPSCKRQLMHWIRTLHREFCVDWSKRENSPCLFVFFHYSMDFHGRPEFLRDRRRRIWILSVRRMLWLFGRFGACATKILTGYRWTVDEYDRYQTTDCKIARYSI